MNNVVSNEELEKRRELRKIRNILSDVIVRVCVSNVELDRETGQMNVDVTAWLPGESKPTSVDINPGKIKSPCVGNCTATSLGDEICKGCGRTFDEVINWNTYSDERKQEIIKRLEDQ